jgi:hypothetical protein
VDIVDTTFSALATTSIDAIAYTEGGASGDVLIEFISSDDSRKRAYIDM